MKIAYVLNTYPQPSQSFIRREILALERAGVDVLRLAMRRFDEPLSDPANAAERERCEYVLHRGALKLLAATLRRTLRAPHRMGRALRLLAGLVRAGGGPLRHLIYLAEAAHVAERCAAEAVDHIHCHFGTNAPAVAMLAHALGAPSFSFTVHGPEEFDAPERLALPLKIRQSAFVVAVSSFGRAQLCRWAPAALWDRIEVVHCGIDPQNFAAPRPMPGPPLKLVSIGRFVEQKGQMTLVQAMAQLASSHPELRLTLIGDGPLRPGIEKAIESHGLERQIALTGWLDESRVNEELAAAHAIVMPSFAEGLPMVLMEALASGRPAVSTLIAGIPELVTPDCGWLVPAGDPAALAEALALLARTPPDRLAEMGRAGRARVLVRHDIDAEAVKLALLFRGAIARAA